MESINKSSRLYSKFLLLLSAFFVMKVGLDLPWIITSSQAQTATRGLAGIGLPSFGTPPLSAGLRVDTGAGARVDAGVSLRLQTRDNVSTSQPTTTEQIDAFDALRNFNPLETLPRDRFNLSDRVLFTKARAIFSVAFFQGTATPSRPDCTGFFVSSDGVFITALHCLEDILGIRERTLQDLLHESPALTRALDRYLSPLSERHRSFLKRRLKFNFLVQSERPLRSERHLRRPEPLPKGFFIFPREFGPQMAVVSRFEILYTGHGVVLPMTHDLRLTSAESDMYTELYDSIYSIKARVAQFYQDDIAILKISNSTSEEPPAVDPLAPCISLNFLPNQVETEIGLASELVRPEPVREVYPWARVLGGIHNELQLFSSPIFNRSSSTNRADHYRHVFAGMYVMSAGIYAAGDSSARAVTEQEDQPEFYPDPTGGMSGSPVLDDDFKAKGIYVSHSTLGPYAYIYTPGNRIPTQVANQMHCSF